MASQRIASFERWLEIYRRARSEIAEGCQIQSLSRDVRGECASEKLRCRQTASLHADAVANANTAGIDTIELDHHLNIAAPRLEDLHAPDILNDSGEHLRAPSCFEMGGGSLGSQPQA